jgi:hypothetical protein
MIRTMQALVSLHPVEDLGKVRAILRVPEPNILGKGGPSRETRHAQTPNCADCGKSQSIALSAFTESV